MKRNRALAIALCLAIVLLMGIIGPVAAQTQPETSASKDIVRYEGTVTLVNKAASTVTLQVKSDTMRVKYTDKTKFTYKSKPATPDDLQEGRRVIVLIDRNEKDMVATRMDVREGK
jgi:hypothetical protein